MQQRPLAGIQRVSVVNRETTPDALDRTCRSAGPSSQGLTAPDTQTHSGQCQPSPSSQAAHAYSAHDTHSTSTSHPREEEVDMDTSPSTPRGTSAPSVRPPDAPRKSKQARPPVQLSPNAPVRKLDFDSNLFRMQSLSDSEQSCASRHNGPG